MDFSDVVPLLRSRSHQLKLRPDELASDWQTLFLMDFSDPTTWQTPDSLLLEVCKPGRIDGVCLAYNAALIDGVRIGNLPADRTTGPLQRFQPFRERLLCGEGDLLEIACRVDDTGLELGSSVELVPAPRVAEFRAARRPA